jgi:hypothetical protein
MVRETALGRQDKNNSAIPWCASVRTAAGLGTREQNRRIVFADRGRMIGKPETFRA